MFKINSLTEKPGAILVEWEENEAVDDRLNGVQEFRLQFAFGDTLNNPHLLVNFHDCYIGISIKVIINYYLYYLIVI